MGTKLSINNDKSKTFIAHLNNSWQWLTKPIETDDVAIRRKSRLLSIFLLSLLLLSAGSEIGQYLTIPNYITPISLASGYLGLLAVYALNRTKYYYWAAWLTIAVFPLGVFAMIISGAANNPGVAISYLVLALLISSIFLKTIGILILAGIIIIGTLLMPIAAPNFVTSYSLLSDALALNIFAAVLAIIAMYHRDQVEKDRQTELQNSESRFRTLAETVAAATFIYQHGKICYVNSTSESLTGYSRKEALGMNFEVIFHPDFRDLIKIQEQVLQQVKNKSAHCELKLLTKYNKERWVDYTTSIIDYNGTPAILGTAFDITERKQTEDELSQYKEQLEDLVSERTAELKKYQDHLQELVAKRTQELSEAFEALQNTQSQLMASEKMAALGELVADATHEINTPLGIGVTMASTLAEETERIIAKVKTGKIKLEILKEYFEIAVESSHLILNNLNRAAELVQSFKHIAVDQTSQKRRSFQVKKYLSEILVSLKPKLKQTKHIININGDETLTLNSYPGEFAQIITNLVLNSLIHAYKNEEVGHLCFNISQLNGHIQIEYTDDGCGIPPEHLNKIFDPFFTTAYGEGGSGLGLHIVHNLVTQKLEGSIRCESEVGHGTKFIIKLPFNLNTKNNV